PGLTDYNIQQGIARLLHSQDGVEGSLLDAQQESIIIANLSKNLPPQRLFKMFTAIREKRINNKRSRRLILTSILNTNRLPFWSVKYRSKLKQALTHAWGVKTTTFVRETLKKSRKSFS